MNFKNISLIHEASSSEPYFVISKDRNIPSAPLTINDDCAYSQLQKKYNFLEYVNGKKEIEHGLLHRIDNETEGLLLIASTQDFYDYIQLEQSKGFFIKHYTALCNFTKRIPDEQFPDFPAEIKSAINRLLFLYENNDKTKHFSPVEFTLTSRFRPFGKNSKTVRPVNEYSGKAALNKASPKFYETKISVTDIVEYDSTKLFKVKCTISSGFRHQVRCHLSWIGLPVYNDNLYNTILLEQKDTDEPASAKQICFTADSFSFNYNGIKKEYNITPDFLQTNQHNTLP